jgi:hypothetical protein
MAEIPQKWRNFAQNIRISTFFWRNFGQFWESKFYCADLPIFGQISAKMAQVAEFFNYCAVVVPGQTSSRSKKIFRYPRASLEEFPHF